MSKLETFSEYVSIYQNFLYKNKKSLIHLVDYIYIYIF
jgi:hypothetical protein